jgi:hypothetical protein
MAAVADGTSYFDRPEKRIYDEGANDISWKVGWSRPASWLEPMPELPMYSRCSSGMASGRSRINSSTGARP